MESWDYFQALLTRDDFSRDLNDGLSSIKVHVRGERGDVYLHGTESFVSTRWTGHLDHLHFQEGFHGPFHRFPRVCDEDMRVPISLQWY